MIPVAVSHDATLRYPTTPPFDPSERYPEFDRMPYSPAIGAANPVYAATREILHALGLDRERFGTADWNPLGVLVRPGGRVVVKPNLVLHEPASLKGSDALTTHGSIIRALVDYALLALRGDGEVVVADCPLQEADIETVLSTTGLDAVLRHFRDVARMPVRFVDFRLDGMVLHPDGRISGRRKLSGDPRGNVEVHLDATSLLEPITVADDRFGAGYQNSFAVANYDASKTSGRHTPGRHAYLIPRTVLESDLFINVPKLKTHQKAGITVCQKNLIGINADKSYLPHYREGSADEGGDEYPYRNRLTAWNRKVRKRFVDGTPALWKAGSGLWRLAKATLLSPRVLGKESTFVANAGVSGGAWHGNDTLWRTILDINRILFLADASGTLRTDRRRAYLAVVDGIVAGEGNGPILPRTRHDGVLLAGMDALAVDVVAARLMGLDWTAIPQLRQAAALTSLRFSDFTGDTAELDVRAPDGRWSRLFDLTAEEHLGFDPPPFWRESRLSAEAAGAPRR